MTCFQPRLRRLLIAAVLSIACDKSPTAPVHPVGTASGKLTVAGAPSSIAVSSQGIAYVTLPEQNEIARFFTAAPTALLPSIPIAVQPWHTAFTRSGNTAFVAAADRDRSVVFQVEVTLGDVPVARPVGQPPYRIVLSRDERRMILLRSGDPAAVLSYPLEGMLDDAQSYITLIPGSARAIVVSPTTGAVYVMTNFRVARLDPVSLNIQMITGPVPVASEDVVISPDGSRIWFGSPNGTLVALDASSLEKVAEIAIGANVRGLALSPDGTQLWATSLGDLLVIDPAQGSIVTRLTLGGTAGYVAFDPAGTTAFVSNDLGWVDVIR